MNFMLPKRVPTKQPTRTRSNAQPIEETAETLMDAFKDDGGDPARLPPPEMEGPFVPQQLVRGGHFEQVIQEMTKPVEEVLP